MLHVLRMPSLKICSILLGILFFYDIFFVFITPLLTKNGKSVMVEVATGGETGEQLPMVLKVNCGAKWFSCASFSVCARRRLTRPPRDANSLNSLYQFFRYRT